METSQRYRDFNQRVGRPDQQIFGNGIASLYNFTPELIYGGADTFDTYQGEDEETLGILSYLSNIAKDIGGRSILSEVLGGAGAMVGGPLAGLAGGIFGLLKGGDLFNAPYMSAGSTYDTPIMRRAGFTPEMLDKMNAAGGYYSAPARAQRNLASRFSNMMDRARSGKNYSRGNLQGISRALGLNLSDSDITNIESGAYDISPGTFTAESLSDSFSGEEGPSSTGSMSASDFSDDTPGTPF